MDDLGKQTISAQPEGSDPEGCYTLFSVIFWLWMLVVMVKGCASGLAPRTDLQPPSPPASKVGIIHAPQSDLVVELSGGIYEVTYEVVDRWALAPGQLHGFFVADFNAGTTRGDFQNAHTLILKGSLNLTISSPGFRSQLNGVIVGSDGVSLARFRHWQPGLHARVEKKIIVVGSLHSVEIGSGTPGSVRNITVFDLRPEELDLEHYRRELMEYERRIEGYNSEREMLNRIRKHRIPIRR